MERKSRVTIDMTPKEHMYLKMSCASLGMSMREFMIQSAFEKIESIEDEYFANKARETLDAIGSGKEKVISWDEMKKRVS